MRREKAHPHSYLFFFKIHYLSSQTYLFGSLVVVAFQSVFRAEMHQNDVFFFIFKKLFLRSVHQNDSKHTKNLNFWGTQFALRSQTFLYKP